MTSVDLANLGVKKNVWTPEITPVDPNMANKLLKRLKNAMERN